VSDFLQLARHRRAGLTSSILARIIQTSRRAGFIAENGRFRRPGAAAVARLARLIEKPSAVNFSL